MTHEYRQALRQLVSDARKTNLRRAGLQLCAGCGCELDIYAYGCKTCHDRKRRRARRKAEKAA